MKMTFKTTAIAASTVACATLLSFGWSEPSGVSLAVDSAQARIGRPLTPLSVAGVARRQYRRAAYGYGAGVVGAGLAAGVVGAAAVAASSPYYDGGYYGGYPGSYYNAYGSYPGYYDGGYVNRSYVTGRPTLIPRYYGGYDTGNYYGSYAAVGYPGSYYGGYGGYSSGGFVNRSYITGRPTLIPRYYGGWSW